MDSTVAAPKAVRYIVDGLRKLSKWCAFFNLLDALSLSTKLKLFTHSGHGSVSIMHSDIPLGRVVSASTRRATIKGLHELNVKAYLENQSALSAPNAASPRAQMNPLSATLCGAPIVVCAI